MKLGLGKTIIAVLAVFVLGGAAFAGGKQEGAAGAPAKLVLGGHTETEIEYKGEKIGAWAALVREFNTSHPSIHLEYQPIAPGGRNMYDVILTMLQAQASTYDIFTSDIFWPLSFVQRNWLYPVDAAFPKSDWADHIPAMINAFSSGGHIYGVPFMNDFRVMFYRMDLLQNSGVQPPDTWDDLISTCVKGQNPPNLYGYAADWQLHQDCEWQEMYWSNGGEYWGEKVTLNGPQGLAALQLMIDMYNKYKITEPGATTTAIEEARQIFTEGKAIFHQNWLYVYPVSLGAESKVQGKVGILRLPRFTKSSPQNVYSTLGGWSWAVNPYTEDKKAALEVIGWLASKETAKWIAMNMNSVPARLSLYQDPDVLAKYPYYKEIGKLAPYTRERFPDPAYVQFFDTARAEIIKALDQSETPQQALDAIAKMVSEATGKALQYPVK
jgi:multiple sugar transport system substrate-binding protein